MAIAVVENRFCFYGAWNRNENSDGLDWFLRTVYPRITGDFHFCVIGGGMSDPLQAKLKAYKTIDYLGFVDNPVREIAQCQALIAPLFKGAGVKVKVIDALSSGTAVIGTDVAFEGIEDNTKNRLFYRANASLEFSALLNNWRNVSAMQKQAAADEFYSRYNTNHFADMVPR